MTERLVRALDLPVPVETLWAFHERPDAFALLQPPWEASEVIELPTTLEVGARAVLGAKLGPLTLRIEAEHIAYERGRSFTDTMLRGPFRSWVHEHRCEPTPTGSRLIDAVDYELPLGVLGKLFGGAMVRRRLERLFTFRHEVTLRECIAAEGA